MKKSSCLRLVIFCWLLIVHLHAQSIQFPLSLKEDLGYSGVKTMKVFYTQSGLAGYRNEVKDFLCYQASFDSAGRFIKQEFFEHDTFIHKPPRIVKYTYPLDQSYRIVEDSQLGIYYHYLNKKNQLDSVLHFKNGVTDTRTYFKYVGKQRTYLLWISANNDTLEYVKNTYDKDTMLSGSVTFLNYHIRSFPDSKASCFYKTITRLGDSTIVKSDHYRNDTFENTTYYYRVYKNKRLVREYQPASSGPYDHLSNRIGTFITYEYNKKGLLTSIKDSRYEYSSVRSYTLFVIKYEYY